MTCFNQTAAATEWFDPYENDAQCNVIFPPKSEYNRNKEAAHGLFHYLVMFHHYVASVHIYSLQMGILENS